MLNKYTVQLMALGIVGSFAATAVAEDSALIDALVKKGVLKSKEAEQIRAEAAKGSHSSGSKLNLDSSVKSLTLSGDIRVRYNYTSGTGRDSGAGAGDNDNFPAGTNDKTAQQTFYDIRLRINADYKLSDDFFAGFGVRTQRDAFNDNALLGNGNNRRVTGVTTTQPGGPGTAFHSHLNTDGGNDFGLGIHRAFLGWRPVEGVELVAGAQKNPFYTTDLVWDADYNPTGFSERIDLNKTLGFGGIDLSVVSGQFVYRDYSENNNLSVAPNRDLFVWQSQLVAGVDLGGAKLTFAPGYLATNNANDDGAHNFQVLLLPGDVTGEVAGIKAKFEWDFAYNFEAKDNADLVPGVKVKSSDRLAWLLGVRLGENKKKGDVSVLANYRRIGQGTGLNGLNDNEIGFGDSQNMGALKVGAAYSLSDSSYFGLNYLRFDRVNAIENGRDGFNRGEWLQAEIGVKF
jgi:hypothetical protein